MVLTHDPSKAQGQSPGSGASDCPLYVDLDGTLTPSDLMWESFARGLRKAPLRLLALTIIGLWQALFQGQAGRARFKASLAQAFPVTRVDLLPWHGPLLSWLRQEKNRGRTLVLATAADVSVASHVAEHTGLFNRVLASHEGLNLKGRKKAHAIAQDLQSHGEKSFGYVGDAHADRPVWKEAQDIIIVSAQTALLKAVKAENPDKPLTVFPPLHPSRYWLKAIRLHQWTKNLLVFLPLIAAHSVLPQAWASAMAAFVALGLIASATYLLNDLFDLEADRAHARKKNRPIASGALNIPRALVSSLVLLALGLGLALQLGQAFLLISLLYLVSTLCYSLWIKQQLFADVLMLAGLYTLRIFAGALASGITVSGWLLVWSIFLFLSLALVKRCAELEALRREDQPKAQGRGYQVEDLPYLRSMGIASGFICVLVLGLYIERPQNVALYSTREILWFTVPLLLAWIMRLWLMTGRGQMHDDPIIFALKDPISWAVGFTILICAGLATYL